MRSVVIGADGFVGRWLVRHLVDQGDEVQAVSGPNGEVDGLSGAAVTRVDVRDLDALGRLLANASCEHLYYLAGVSDPEEREAVPQAVGVGVIGPVNVLTALAMLPGGGRRRVLHVGSSHVYGPQATSPIDESAPTNPRSVYGATKLAAERVLTALGPQFNIDVVLARPFNHIGPGQRGSFVVPSLARQVAAVAAGTVPSIVRLESIETARDFTDVRDVVRGYRLMLVHGEPGVTFNIASGRAVTTGEIAALLMELAGIEARIEVTGETQRDGEAKTMVGDFARLEAATGWRPAIQLRDTLTDVLADARMVSARA